MKKKGQDFQKELSPQNEENFFADKNAIKEENAAQDEKIKQELFEKIDKESKEKKGDEFTDAKEQRKRLDAVEQSVSEQGSKKKKRLNYIVFALNIIVVAGILLFTLTRKGFTPFKGTLHGWPIVLTLVFLCLVIGLDTLSISYQIKRTTGAWHPFLSYKVGAIGRYYDSITPLSTGGQPFQISYLKNRDYPVSTALSVPIAKMVFQQLGWVLISFVCLIISFTNRSYSSLVSIASIIGFMLGSFLLLFIIFISTSKTVGRKLIVLILKFLQKIKLVKNFEKTYDKLIKFVEDYQAVIKHYATSFQDFIVLFLCALLKLICVYSFPYFVVSIFAGFNGSAYFSYFVVAVLIDLAAGFFPIPGGTGMSEIIFSTMIGILSGLGEGVVFWALLLWRFCTYYVYLLQGIGVLSYDVIYGNRKFKWKVRCQTLVEESNLFKDEQIAKFRVERLKRRRTNKNRS